MWRGRSRVDRSCELFSDDVEVHSIESRGSEGVADNRLPRRIASVMSIQPLKSERPRSAFGIMLKIGDNVIRTSTKADGDAIRECIDSSFGSSRYESRLRDGVVRNEPDHCEWVVERDSKIIGHILYTPATGRGANLGYHLGPVLIGPGVRKHGIGS